jgi:hypothetical protein
MTAIYVGAGIDIRPLQDLSGEIKHFHFIDSLPFSVHGKKCKIENGRNIFSRSRFIDYLNKTMKEIEFRIDNELNDLIIYKKNDIVLYYHINTAIPDDIEKIRSYISGYDTLIIAGYDPHIDILLETNKSITMIGYKGAYFGKDDKCLDEKDTIVNKLHSDEISFHFKKFIYIDNKRNKQHIFEKWSDFVSHSLSV